MTDYYVTFSYTKVITNPSSTEEAIKVALNRVEDNTQKYDEVSVTILDQDWSESDER